MTLLETQRKMAAALMLPLTPDNPTGNTEAENPLAQAASSLIKPNAHLTSLERLEIYRRSYWFRLLNSLRDDFPGLLAILGSTGFDKLAEAYLVECPSQSFTLRDLGSGLQSWLKEHPHFAGKDSALAMDMVRLEWAHIVAFDGDSEKVLGPEHLIELKPRLRMGIQPYISLLDLQFPVDELRVQVNADEEGSTITSNVALKRSRQAARLARRVQPAPIFVAVHRLELSVFYRRLQVEEFRLLENLRSGRSISDAINLAFQDSAASVGEIPRLLQLWFSTWSRFGWLTVPP